jgi:D-glycero-D-manno-heptose 1,7-bisphosphate phosphatase
MDADFHGLLRDAWCWGETRISAPQGLRGRPALFFDRDGVLIEEVGYISRPEDMRLTPGAAASLRAVREKGLASVLVTNQSGIGRGFYDWPDFRSVQDAMHAALAREGAALDLVYACGWAPKEGAPDHPWRKPAPGMLAAAAADAGLDLARSAIIGDRASDLAAGRSAGLGAGILLAAGYGAASSERGAASALARPGFRVAAAAHLGDAVAAALAGQP